MAWEELAGWARAVIAAIPLIRGWLRNDAAPEPIETAYVSGDKAFLEIENRGAAALYTAEILKAVNVEGWPSKTVWARWDNDKNARNMRIPRKTKSKLRIAQKFDRPQGLKWRCFFGTDHQMGQQILARSKGDPQWVAELHVQLVSEPEFTDGPRLLIVFLRADGTITCLPKSVP